MKAVFFARNHSKLAPTRVRTLTLCLPTSILLIIRSSKRHRLVQMLLINLQRMTKMQYRILQLTVLSKIHLPLIRSICHQIWNLRYGAALRAKNELAKQKRALELSSVAPSPSYPYIFFKFTVNSEQIGKVSSFSENIDSFGNPEKLMDVLTEEGDVVRVSLKVRLAKLVMVKFF